MKNHARLLLLAAPLFSMTATAQAVDDVYTVSESVVSAAGYEQDTREAPASVTVITNKDLTTRPVGDIGQAVGDVPGVDISSTKMGNSTVSIRGFDYQYTMMLVDGRRQNTSTSMIANGFDPASAFLLPPAAIERIEVMRGPASTIYGTDAVGGVVNVITKKHVDKFTGTIQIDRTQFQDSEWGHRTSASVVLGVPLVEDTATLMLRGRYQKRDETTLKYPNGEFAGHSPSESYNGNIGGRLNLTIDPANELWIDGDFTRFQGGTMMTSQWGYQAERDYEKYNLSAGHNGKYSFGELETYFQWNSLSLLRTAHGEGTKNVTQANARASETKGTRSDPLQNSTTYTLASKLRTPFELGSYGNMMLTTGIQLDYETYKDNTADSTVAAEFTGHTYAGMDAGTTLDQTTAAIFAEDEYFINDQFIATVGGRLHWSDDFGAHFSPRAYLVYKPTEILSFKGGVATGYMAPGIKQLYDGVYAFSQRSGVNTYTVGDKNLKPEESVSYELSMTLQEPTVGSLTLGVFHTNFKNKLSTETVYTDQNNTVNQDVNHDKVRAQGVEVLMKTAQFKGFSFTGGYTLTDSEIRAGENVGGRENELPRHTVTARIDYQNNNFSAYLKSVSKYDAMVEKTTTTTNYPGDKYKSYTKVDLGASYVYNKRHHFSVALNNLFDVGVDNLYYQTSTSSGYVNAYQEYIDGRNLWASYAYTF